MKVLVTGGAGHIGKAATERLVQHGWDVRAIGLEAETEVQGVEYVTCDVLNYDDLRQQMRGCEAVIHLAAIPRPQLAPGHKIFTTNVAGTFNVFEAAAAEGIKRVVQASSINALGTAFGLVDFAPQYFPIDEQHPVFTTDPYSFSKQTIEEIGRYYWRRDGISSVALRFPGVQRSEYAMSDEMRERRQSTWKVIDEFAALTATEREARLAGIRKRTIEYRQQHPWEFKETVAVMPPRNQEEDQLWYIYAFDRFNLWAFIDVRDAAQALEKGLTAEYDSAHPLFVSDPQNWLGYDARSLVRLFFPEVSESNINLSGPSAMVSVEAARRLIGFEPEYSVAFRVSNNKK